MENDTHVTRSELPVQVGTRYRFFETYLDDSFMGAHPKIYNIGRVPRKGEEWKVVQISLADGSDGERSVRLPDGSPDERVVLEYTSRGIFGKRSNRNLRYAMLRSLLDMYARKSG